MSDSEPESLVDDEDESGSEDDNSSQSEQGDGSIVEQKGDLVKEDIELIKEVFGYIDQTSKRLCDKVMLGKELRDKISQAQRREQLERMDRNNNDKNPDLSWAQYENLDEAQRADLLEKAIMVLTDA